MALGHSSLNNESTTSGAIGTMRASRRRTKLSFFVSWSILTPLQSSGLVASPHSASVGSATSELASPQPQKEQEARTLIVNNHPEVQIANPQVNDYFLMLTIPAMTSVNISIFEATLKCLKCTISMSQVLPHTRFPIGHEGSPFQRLDLIDSGAGLNCGCLAYHSSIAERYQEITTSRFNGQLLIDLELKPIYSATVGGTRNCYASKYLILNF